MKKHINKKWRKIAWYNKLIIVSVGVVLALSPLVTVPVGIGLELAYGWLVGAVVAFEVHLGVAIGKVERASFEFIGYIAALMVVPLTVGVTARLMSKKSSKSGKSSKNGMKYEVSK